MNEAHVIRALGVLDLFVVLAHVPKFSIWARNFGAQPFVITCLLLTFVAVCICAFTHLRAMRGWQLWYYASIIPRGVFGFLTFMPLLWLFPRDVGQSTVYSLAVTICFALEVARGAFTVIAHWRSRASRAQ